MKPFAFIAATLAALASLFRSAVFEKRRLDRRRDNPLYHVTISVETSRYNIYWQAFG